MPDFPTKTIRNLRLATGVSQRALARTAGIDHRRYRLLENGITDSELKAIAKAIGVRVELLRRVPRG